MVKSWTESRWLWSMDWRPSGIDVGSFDWDTIYVGVLDANIHHIGVPGRIDEVTTSAGRRKECFWLLVWLLSSPFCYCRQENHDPDALLTTGAGRRIMKYSRSVLLVGFFLSSVSWGEIPPYPDNLELLPPCLLPARPDCLSSPCRPKVLDACFYLVGSVLGAQQQVGAPPL